MRAEKILWAVCLNVWVLPVCWGAAAVGRLDILEQSITAASENGDFSRVEDLRLQLAREAAKTNHYSLAARQYELLLAARPSRRERVALFIELGRMQDALQDYGRAIEAYGNALHDDPRSWEANLALARAYARVELNTKALQAYQCCLAIKPSAHEAYQEIACVYQRLGFLNKAIGYFEKALKLDAQPETYLAIADCYVRQDDIARAADILQRAKSVLPRADYDARLGDIYRKRGKLARACPAWEEALKLDPHREDIRLNLAVAYGLLHRREDADRLFRSLLSTYPGSPLVHFLHAWVLYDQGQFADSRNEALTVQHLAPTEMVRYYNDRLLGQLKRPS